MDEGYRHQETCVYLCNYHLIWCPKRRRKILCGPLQDRLETLLIETAAELGVDLLAVEVMPDHLHLFVSADPHWAPNQLVARFKGRTSRLLRQEFPFLLKMPSLWTRSYFCSTAGNVSSDTIRRYIQAQRTRE
jgi:putative transposase